MHATRLTVLLTVLALSAPAFGQQTNTSTAGLSINGTGRVDASGTTIPTASQIVPPPPASAPFFHHRSAPGVSLEFRVDGPPLRPLILLAGQPAGMPIPVGTDFLELSQTTAQVLINGVAPRNLFDLGAITSGLGVWRFYSPIGLPPGFGPLTLQAIIFDPSHPPFGLRFTASVTLDTGPDIETLARNFFDARAQALDNPLYLPSTCSTTFKLEGLSSQGLLVLESARALGRLGEDDPIVRTEVAGLGPDTTSSPPLPVGAPAGGQVATAFVDFTDHVQDDPCAVAPPRGERARFHGARFIEEGGVWRVDGDQRDVVVSVVLDYAAGSSNPQGLDVFLSAFVEDQVGLNLGIAAVTITGPQLQNVNAGGQSTSATSGTQNLVLADGGGGGPSCWEGSVQLAAAGSSRFPLVENGAGPRDVYSIFVSWNDGSSSGPYAIPLRSAVDASASPAAALAAAAGTGGLTGTLNNASSPSASVDLTLSLGSLPSADDFGRLSVFLFQNGLAYEFENLRPLYTPGGNATLSFCTPFFLSGLPATVDLEVYDREDTLYFSSRTVNL